MKSNPILEEAWRIKDQLAQEAGYDIHTFCQQLMEWAKAHPHNGPIVETANELRGLTQGKECEQAQTQAPALKEEPPKYGGE